MDLEALNEESAFAAWQQRPKGFKGTCNHCGTYGHKGVDCFQRKKNEDGAKPTESQSKFGGQCWICRKSGHRESECRRNLNDRMKDSMAALAQTMSLFDQKKDDESDTQYNYSEEDDNESYAELGFLAMNVAGRDSGESNRMERCQRSIYYTNSTCGGLYIDSSDDERKGALLLAIMHAISYQKKSRLQSQ